MTHETQTIHSTSATVERWLCDAGELGSRDVYNAKRDEARTTWTMPLVFKPQSGDNRGDHLYVRGKNLSVHGMAAVSRKSLAAGTLLHICDTNETEYAVGRVVHCTATLGAYIIGVAFDQSPEGM